MSNVTTFLQQLRDLAESTKWELTRCDYELMLTPLDEHQDIREAVLGLGEALRPRGPHVVDAKHWTHITVYDDLTVWKIRILKTHAGEQQASLNGWAVLMILLYIHGWVVAPGWSKLWCLLVFPSYYFSIEAWWGYLT